MPIRPELRKFYGREWSEVTRPRILARAGNKCEQCKKPNGELIETVTDSSMEPRMWWRPIPPRFRSWRNAYGEWAGREFKAGIRRIRVVLTIAHLNHVAGDDRDSNLKALCQWCHLNYDKVHHHETRATRKDASRELLGA
jgi:hypothetical protein